MLHLRCFNNNRESKFLFSLENPTRYGEPVLRFNKSFRRIDGLVKKYKHTDYYSTRDFLGYIDGIIVMHMRYDYLGSDAPNEIALWNPSISKYILIPKAFAKWENFNVGFGFDNLRNGYKVVIFYMKYPYVLRYMIYHLCRELSSWSSEKKVECPSPNNELYMKPYSSMTNYEGGVYWICYDSYDMNCGLSRILRFDLSSERYSCISLPQDEYKIGKNSEDSRCLSVMKTSLTVVDCHYMEHISVWVLDKDVKIDSWTKLYNVDLKLYECLVLKSNGELLFREGTKGVVLCDLESVEKTLKKVAKGHSCPIPFMQTYEESLVLLKEFLTSPFLL